MDVKSPEQRSINMAAIKNSNTKPEIKLRKSLHALGLRYRLNYNITGKPDIVFPKKKLVVFVDGCFWHGCLECYKAPDNNKEFWKNKIISNKKRDSDVNEILQSQGWRIIRVWEHKIKKDVERIAGDIKRNLNLNTDKVD